MEVSAIFSVSEYTTTKLRLLFDLLLEWYDDDKTSLTLL